MWVTKDERRLLAGYYHLLDGVSVKKTYHIDALSPLLGTYSPCAGIKEYGHEVACSEGPTDIEERKAQIRETVRAMKRIAHANNLLAKRGFITVQDHQWENNVIVVALTWDGYDLGRRYACWWERIDLWFKEYRDSWFMALVGFLRRIISAWSP